MDKQMLQDLAKYCDNMAAAEVVGTATAQEKARQKAWLDLRDGYLAAISRLDGDTEPEPEPQPDNPPTVAITSPTPGLTVSGMVNVVIASSDEDLSTLVVTGSVDSGPAVVITATPWVWDTSSLPDGTHTLTVVATDKAGQVAQAGVSVITENDAAPTVVITSPVANATVAGTITCTATASDDRSVTSVSFSVDGQAQTPDTSSPYTYSWDTTKVSDGSHTLVATVTDSANQKAASTSVSVTVKNAVVAPSVDGRSVTPANTGWQPTGVILASYSGTLKVTTAGTVIDGKDINGSFTVDAPNVTIKRSRIKAGNTDYGFVATPKATNLLVEDTEITSATPGGCDRAVFTQGGSCTFRRVLARGTRRGYAPGSNTLLDSCYYGDNVNNTDAHTSAVGAWGGLKNFTMKNCNFSTAPGTNASSACSFYPESAANTGILLDGCLFDTGGGYALYVGYTPPQEQPNQITVQNCWFGVRYNPNCGQYAPVSNAHGGLQAGGGSWTNNRWHAPGQSKDKTTVPLPS
jgi:Bacterial Ig domain/Bacterial Ig-like domain